MVPGGQIEPLQSDVDLSHGPERTREASSLALDRGRVDAESHGRDHGERLTQTPRRDAGPMQRLDPTVERRRQIPADRAAVRTHRIGQSRGNHRGSITDHAVSPYVTSV